MKTKRYCVISVDTDVVRPWLLNRHYLKRMCSTSYRFALIKDGVVFGVVTYGNALPNSVVESPFGKSWSHCVQELNRLVLSENAPKHAASFLISQSIKQLPKPTIVLSYADAGKGHVGYVYQSTNFIYTGKSHTQKDWKLKSDPDRHSRTLMDEFAFEENRIEKLKSKYGEDLIQVERPAKHRYLYIHGSKSAKKSIIKDARFMAMPYPKGDSVNLCTESEGSTQMLMF
jgi:hypothetical protein